MMCAIVQHQNWLRMTTSSNTIGNHHLISRVVAVLEMEGDNAHKIHEFDTCQEDDEKKRRVKGEMQL